LPFFGDQLVCEVGASFVVPTRIDGNVDCASDRSIAAPANRRGRSVPVNRQLTYFPMLKRRVYYELKPHIPRLIRMILRRWHAKIKRWSCGDIWPILDSAGRLPEGWKGWPDGNRFALVLTHDVERTKGLQRCQELMELEMKLGYRSSFNFVPEGDYTVPKELRDTLSANGFEVGVHDLRHDGRLYYSRKDFVANAQRINDYLKEWKAVGFRSGFMHHNLEWLQDLDVLYDSSTFDTDPFEPQPDGVNTIFPFWVSGQNGRRGYLELPYTLSQDSTLFLVFEETNIDIWKRKLDWIAERGGMVLLNTHPDYMTFRGKRLRDQYPVRYYQELLEYSKPNYEGLFWSALPRELAEYVLLHQRKGVPPGP